MISRPSEMFSTYSIVARDKDSGEFGAAVQTHQMCVGAVVPWLTPSIGAVVTQAMTNISFGPIAMSMLREGFSAQHIVDGLAASDPEAHRRQFAVVDAHGNVGAWTGFGCIPEAAHHIGDGYSVQANMMSKSTVVGAMAEAFEISEGDLASRMVAALEAAQAEDGDIRGMQSAALKVVPGTSIGHSWRTKYDLRVDEHDNPVAELGRLVRLQRARLMDTEGYERLDAGERDAAEALWHTARDTAPELEELPFWQAITLADDPYNDIPAATKLLQVALQDNPRSAHWIELIRRLAICGLLEAKGVDEALIEALG